MYLGKIVETAEKKTLYEKPEHPYTQALVSSVPIPDPETERKRKRITLVGEIPSAENPPPGCAFSTRCPWVQARCKEESPSLNDYQGPSQKVACFEVGKHEAR